MSQVLVTESYLEDIAEAIRAKSGESVTYRVSQMAFAIESIHGAVIQSKTITSNGTYSAPSGVDGFSPITVSVSGSATEDATLSSGNQLLYGVTAYAKGSKYTGTIPMYNGSINGSQGSIPGYDYYSGSYVATPSAVSQSFPTAGKLLSHDFVVESYSASVYSGPYNIMPSTVSQSFPTAGLMMSEDLYIGSYSGGAAVLSEITILDNGSYTPPSGIDGYSQITVSVNKNPYDTKTPFVDASGVLTLSTLSIIDEPSAVTVGMSAFKSCRPLRQVSLPSCTQIYYDAFNNCESLAEVSVPSCTYIGVAAFANCHQLSLITVGALSSIGSRAFEACYALEQFDFGNCSAIPWKAFYSCTTLSTVFASECVEIASMAFMNCHALEDVILPSCVSIGAQAFSFCSSLNYLSAENCTYIGASAFESTPLAAVNIPEIVTIEASAFKYCRQLRFSTHDDLSKCEYIGKSAFYYCDNSSFHTIHLPKCSYIGEGAFGQCLSLDTVHLLASSVCTLGSSNAFLWTKIQSFYLTASLFSAYQTAPVWRSIFSLYSSKFHEEGV